MAKCGKYQPIPPWSIEHDNMTQAWRVKLIQLPGTSCHSCFCVVDPYPNSLQVRLIRKSPSKSEEVDGISKIFLKVQGHIGNKKLGSFWDSSVKG